MKIAIIGNRGHINIPLEDLKTADGCDIIGVCGDGADISAEGVVGSCERVLGITPPVFEGDYRAMLDVTQPDVAVVCGRFETHAEMTVEAMNRGIHVFSEKPVATTFEDLEKVAEACRTNKGIVLGHMCGPHYDPGMWDATQQIEAIGNVRLMHAQKSYKLGQREAYFMNRKSSAGLIPWVGIHAISWLYHFAGRSPFESVLAVHNSDYNRNHGDLEMTASCLFTFAGGISATLSVDYLRPMNGQITHGDDQIRVMGTAGALHVAGGVCEVLTEKTSATYETTPVAGMFEDFLRKVRGETSNAMTGEDVIRITEAALQARACGDGAGVSERCALTVNN